MIAGVDRIRFDVGGVDVVGALHRPKDRRRCGVVLAGPMTSVKEQVTGAYAAAFARLGFTALAIDHRHFGESAGMPRQLEDHRRKVEDLRAAVDWLLRHGEVAEVALVGICLGAGYASAAAIEEPRIARLGLVVGYYRDPAEMRARDPDGFARKCAQGTHARQHYERTGEVLTIPAAAIEGDAAMSGPDTFDYYCRRAKVATYVNELAVMSRESFVPFDVQALAPRLKLPVAMVHSENALSPAWARAFYAKLDGCRTLDWISSRGHTDFYDDPSLVDAAATLLARRFEAHRGASNRQFDGG